MQSGAVADKGLPDGLGSAISLVLASDLPGRPRARRRDIDLILGARQMDRGLLGARSRASFEAALIRAAIISGFPREAAAWADRGTMEILQRVAGSASASTQSVCYAALSQAYSLNGRIQEGADCARVALDYAREAGDDACLCLGQRLLGLALALNGEFSEAARLSASATALGELHGWAADDWASAWTTVLNASRTGEVPAITACLDRLAGAGHGDALQRAIIHYGNAYVFTLREEYRSAIVELHAISHGVDRRSCPPFLVDMALALNAISLLQLGDQAAALRSVADRRSPPTHSVCFELIRATIHIQLGEPREALRATEPCVHDCPDHSLRTLPSVLLRRAVASEMLGHSDTADQEFSRSSHLAAGLSGTAPALGLPLDILERLLLRLVANEPEFGREVLKRLPPDGRYPDVPTSSVEAVRLTARERVLAEWLISGLTLTEIADELHVSINTLKTQSRSLYRKLEVSSRAEAVQRLERMPHVVETAARLRP